VQRSHQVTVDDGYAARNPSYLDKKMIEQEIEIINKLGLHARASAKLTQLAAKYQSEVWMTRNKRRVNAKSIMGVMMLAAGKGTTVMLEVNGPDEKECVDALLLLIQDKFGEGE